MWSRGSDRFITVCFPDIATLDVLWSSLEIIDEKALSEQEQRKKEFEENLKADSVRRLSRLFQQIGIAEHSLFVDEAPEERRELNRLLSAAQSGELAVFASASIFALGSSFAECVDVLETLAAHKVRVLLPADEIDTDCLPVPPR